MEKQEAVTFYSQPYPEGSYKDTVALPISMGDL